MLRITLLLGMFIYSCATPKEKLPPMESRIVEAACGICQFDMTGDQCDLAVKIDHRYYYVEGSTLIEHGNEHADDGMCNVVRHAKVSGEIKYGVFRATSFELIPATTK